MSATDMAAIQLISTDFDGTLIPFSSDGRCTAELAAALADHAAAGGAWALNTGRSLEHAREGLERFGAPVEPDFLLINEREVYHRQDNGIWAALGDWNEICRVRHGSLFAQATGIFASIERLAERKAGFTMLYEEEQPVGLVTEDEATMEAVVGEIEREAAWLPDFHYQRNTIYLRFCHRDYHKGSALGELCRVLEIEPEFVLAAGDHFNDLSMLDGTYAKLTACPSNAIAAVKHVVERTGGYIARQPSGDGVAEAIRYFQGKLANRRESQGSSRR